MAGQSGDLFHLGILPDVDFILRVPMSADQFVETLAENEVADLRSHIHGFDCGSIKCVTETDSSVSGTST